MQVDYSRSILVQLPTAADFHANFKQLGKEVAKDFISYEMALKC